MGGAGRTGHAKTRRPIAPKSHYHIVLKSQKARGPLSMLRPERRLRIQKLIYTKARQFFVRIDSYSNVGNHLHLKVYAQGSREFQNFLRTITALISRLVTGAKKGVKFGRFWDGLVFTRILRSKAEHEILSRYIFANTLEATFGRATRNEYLELWYKVPGWRKRLKPILLGL